MKGGVIAALHAMSAVRRVVGRPRAEVVLQGVSCSMSVHAALAEHERAINTSVAHPLMARLELPYPLLVGRVRAGRWSSQVPDELEFEGRLGVAVGGDLAQARAARVARAIALTILLRLIGRREAMATRRHRR